MKEPGSISLAMIVRNEARYLPGCLESVRGIVDEIVIVDTGSTDGTPEMAAELGARVYSFPWNDDFAGARNESLSHCRCEWILVLDADERLAAGQKEPVRQCARARGAVAHTLLVKGTATLPAGPSTQVMPFERLFRNVPGIRFEGTVHEQVASSIRRMGGVVSPSSIVIEHLGYAQGPEALERKAERNRRLLLARLAKSPNDAYACYHMGNMAAMFQQYEDARSYLRRALAADGLPPPLRAVSWALLAEIALRMGRLVEAAGCCRSSLALAPRQMAARWYLVGTFVQTKDYTAACACLREILQMFFEGAPPAALDVSVDVYVDEWRVRLITGQCLWKIGDTSSALRSFEAALRLNPQSQEILSNLALARRSVPMAASGSRPV
ncbi:MAG TPA: glycosyltransferase [Bacteroidota bacterium]|nr:glycosyltransferase [Bacteroidota bacterium]